MASAVMGMCQQVHAQRFTDNKHIRHLLQDQEDLDIHYNKHVEDILVTMEANDRLNLLYIVNSNMQIDATGQDWTILDQIFLKVLSDLQPGYIITYVMDCAEDRSFVSEGINLHEFCALTDKFQPNFTLYGPAEIKVNPYTGKPMDMQSVHY